MVFLLGINFPDRLLVRKALTSLYGISSNSASFAARAPSSPPLSAFTNHKISPAAAAVAAITSPPASSSSLSSVSATRPAASSSSSGSRSNSSSPSDPSSSRAQTARDAVTGATRRGQTAQTAQDAVSGSIMSGLEASTPPVLAQGRYNPLSRLLAEHHIHPYARLSELTLNDINALTASLTSLTIENELKRQVRQNILRLRDMGSYRGRRHTLHLPVRGQRTRTQIVSARRFNRVEWRN